MPLHRLDHVNILTANLDRMVGWYERVLGMTLGDRPPFRIGGAWLYLEGFPIVHLVEVERQPETVQPKLEHFAITASGLKDFLDTLAAEGVDYTLDPVPVFPVVQVNFRDPDGNHIHVDFPKAEADALS